MHKALGRGLESLLPVTLAQESSGKESIVNIPADKIKPNRYQARTNFDPQKLEELADSIKQHGLAQPLIVTPSPIPGEYELIAGERRLRACQIAGLKEINVVIRKASEKERFMLSMVENIQREDLNPMEEAHAYRRIASEYSLKQEEIAKLLGKDRSVVANSVRLLNLPSDMQKAVSSGVISGAHGRILAGIENAVRQKLLFEKTVSQKLSVRELERLSSEWKAGFAKGKKGHKKLESELLDLSEDLQRRFGTKVKITGKPQKGKIEIFYFSLKDLERIVALVKSIHRN